jgi:pimeloyl-ACP methyl ester carboxylesterase
MGIMDRVAYDEFGLFHENASEHGLAYPAPPVVRRVTVVVADGCRVSGLVWGADDAQPEIVFIHGGAQNAHTWDTVAMAMGRPAVAIDLPGHGHSDWRDDGAYTPSGLADDVATVIEALAQNAAVVVGMSLGGLTAMELANRHPALVRRLVMVDITPGVDSAKAKAVIDFVNGPQSFPSFESLLARTIEHNPTRTESSLRRGILHNARQLDDGSWQWRYDRGGRARADAEASRPPDLVEEAVGAAMNPLWDHFGSIRCPIMLVRGRLSPVVDDADVAEASRRQHALRVEVVDGAGHSVQGDRPLELAELVNDFIGG